MRDTPDGYAGGVSEKFVVGRGFRANLSGPTVSPKLSPVK